MITPEIQNYVANQIKAFQKDSLYSTKNSAWHTHNGLDSPKIASSSASNPSGSILAYGGSSAPSGYLICDGTSYLRNSYADLFAAIGTKFGSADGTHFNVPDLRANVPAGYKSGDANFGTLGGAVGEATHTLTTPEMPSHTHSGSFFVNAIGGNTLATSGTGVAQNTAGVGSTGGGGAHNNIQPSLTVNFIIKT